MRGICYRIAFNSELFKVREVIKNIEDCVKTSFPYINDDDLFDLRLIYGELLANAVVHGNREDKSKKVELFIKTEMDSITSVIRDEGSGFDYTKELRGQKAESGESGRGLVLVRALTDSLRFNGIGNMICFKKPIAGKNIA